MQHCTVVFIASKTDFYMELREKPTRENMLVRRNRTLLNEPALLKSDQPYMIVLVCNSKKIDERNTCRSIKDRFHGLILVINEPEDRELLPAYSDVKYIDNTAESATVAQLNSNSVCRPERI